MALLPVVANAYDAYIDGIYYNLVSKVRTAEVTKNQNFRYTGTVNIPETITYNGITYTVTSISDYAFYGCSGLTSVTIGSGVTSIGNYVFSDCQNLTSLIVESGNPQYDSRDNCNAIIETATNTLVAGCINTVIPNNVTSIGQYAFAYCRNLTSIIIPNGVTNIGFSAFQNCSGLISITIPESVTTIGYNAFLYCDNLTSVHITDLAAWCNISFDYQPLSLAHHLYLNGQEIKNLVIPESVKKINRSTFSGCSGLTSVTIPNSVTSIGDYAFNNCSGLTSITIPNNVTSIGSSAFSGCSGLTSVTIPNSVTSINRGTFYGCTSLTSITIPNSVTNIGEKAFYNCTTLATITIPSCVNSIGRDAFSGCSGLTSVHITDLAAWCNISFINQPLSLAHHLYLNGQEINNLVIPESVKKINSSTFSGCTSLTSVTIPNSVTSIGKSAFEGCGALSSVSIGSGVTSILENAFANCPALLHVYCYAENVPNTNSNVFDGSDIQYATLHVPVCSVDAYKWSSPWRNFGRIVTIGDTTSPPIAFSDANVKALCVANWDLNGDEELEEAEAAAVTTLGVVFVENSTITSFNELRYFTGLTSIGEKAFYGCYCLNSISIPESVINIKGSSFENCHNLSSITIPSSVTIIGDKAFSGCSSLTSVTIPHNVSSIGFSAFSGCANLTDVTLNSDDIVSASRTYETSMKSIFGEQVKNYILGDAVNSIGNCAFFRCDNLISVTIPESVTKIGNDAFNGDNGLTTINIPSSVKSIGSYAFKDCSGLSSIFIPESITSIAAGVYFGCNGLTSISIPESVTNIGEKAFYNCTTLATITIPSSVNSIGNEAFRYCGALTDVYCYAESVPSTGNNVFYGSSITSATLHVPASAIYQYNTIVPWKDFKSIVPIEGGPTPPTPEKCATPTISYANGKLKFNSETEGVTFHYSLDIEDDNIKSGIGDKVQLSVTYHISVYATREDYYDSEVATGTLCWIDQQPSTEGIVNEDVVTEVKALPVLIQSNRGTITVQGANEGTEISVFSVNGMMLGSAIATQGLATINTSLTLGTTAIVKIGEKAIKVLIK